MQNVECKIEVCPKGMIKNVSETDSFILHFEFCILHFTNSREMLSS